MVIDSKKRRLEALKGFRDAIIFIRRIENCDQKEKAKVMKFLLTQAARETPVDPIAEPMVKQNKYYCPECEGAILIRTKYCCHCGQKLSWKILKDGAEG